MTRFIMIRHGFSVANKEKKFAGHSDFPLTDLGRLQAEKCAEALKDEHIDAIYASDLSRAFGTAEAVARVKGMEIVPTCGLREIYAGEWEGLLFDELCVKFADAYAVWRTDIGRAQCTGGERVRELSDRVLGTLREIAAENEGKTVCIATHATPIRAVCTSSAGLDAEEMAKIPWVSNASINVFELEDGIFRAVAVDQTAHLGDLSTKLPSNV